MHTHVDNTLHINVSLNSSSSFGFFISQTWIWFFIFKAYRSNDAKQTTQIWCISVVGCCTSLSAVSTIVWYMIDLNEFPPDTMFAWLFYCYHVLHLKSLSRQFRLSPFHEEYREKNVFEPLFVLVSPSPCLVSYRQSRSLHSACTHLEWISLSEPKMLMLMCYTPKKVPNAVH